VGVYQANAAELPNRVLGIKRKNYGKSNILMYYRAKNIKEYKENDRPR
jgi:hypothetical protein